MIFKRILELTKKIDVVFLILAVVLTMAMSCRPEGGEYLSFSDTINDRKYNIKIQYDSLDQIKTSVDSIITKVLSQIDVKTPNSLVSRLNGRIDSLFFEPSNNTHFVKIFEVSKVFYKETNGSFNPALLPLFEYHGTGYSSQELKKGDSLAIKKLMSLTHFDSIFLAGPNLIVKKSRESKISYEAILYGYIVDEIAAFFESKKVRNYIIELDGKCRSHGVDQEKSPWSFGINRPSDGIKTDKKELPINISNKSIATSGAYFDINTSKGLQYASIIDPVSGQKRLTDILSATVLTDDCLRADAYATALMTMGLETALVFINSIKDASACFVYDAEGDGVFEFKTSERFARNLVHNEQKK
jgi:thiamine biosynthesis lipoprotein